MTSSERVLWAAVEECARIRENKIGLQITDSDNKIKEFSYHGAHSAYLSAIAKGVNELALEGLIVDDNDLEGTARRAYILEKALEEFTAIYDWIPLGGMN